MNYFDGKHYIITLLLPKSNYTENIIKHYIISDNNPLQNKEIDKYLSKWKKEFFYEFGDTEDKPRTDIYAEEYGLFGKEFDCIYNDWVQNYLNNIEVECILITNKYKTDCLNKQSWIKL